jgi:hypothetical protein
MGAEQPFMQGTLVETTKAMTERSRGIDLSNRKRLAVRKVSQNARVVGTESIDSVPTFCAHAPEAVDVSGYAI